MLHKKVIGVLSAAALMTVFAGAPAFAGTNTNNGPDNIVNAPGAPVLGSTDGSGAGVDGNGTGSGDTTLTVNPGYLEFDPVDVNGPAQDGVGAWQMPNFTAITLGGTPELTGVRIPPFSVIDATGSAAGWHVNATVTDLVHNLAADTGVLARGVAGPDYTIYASTMSMTRPWVVDQATTTAPDIATRTNNGDVVPADVASFDALTGNKIVSANPANMVTPNQNPTNGTFLISPMPLRVLVPSDASAGTYAATVTLDLVSGP
jgi:hypothetical protein